MPLSAPTYPTSSTYTNMDLDEAINRMMTCATAERCAREEACFRVVLWAKERRERERTAEALDRATDPDEIADYAPDWSAA